MNDWLDRSPVWLVVILSLAGLAVIVVAGVAVLFFLFPGTQGAVQTDARTISIWHDDQHSVTCWIYKNANAGGLSCLPDTSIPR